MERVEPKPEVLRLSLYVALVKFERMELVFEKGTELGVARFVPVIAERSERGRGCRRQSRRRGGKHSEKAEPASPPINGAAGGWLLCRKSDTAQRKNPATGLSGKHPSE